MTIYDIAKEAGVSTATVSRVINNSGYVAKEKKEKILAIIEKHNYMPSAIAQGLTNKQTRTIGMLVPDVMNPFFATIFVAIEEEAMRHDYNVILCNYVNDNNSGFQQIDMLLKKQVDAIIQLGGPSDVAQMPEETEEIFRELKKKLPVVTNGILPGNGYYSVRIDDSGAMREMLQEMYAFGHRRFAIIGGDDRTIPSVEKQKLFTEILREMGIPKEDRIVLGNSRFDISGGRVGVRELQKQGALPTVLIGINEFVAAGIARELLEQKYSVPQDISVVGFDNTYLSELTVPALSCIGCDYKAYAHALMELLLNAFEGKKSRKKVQVASVYYRRESTGKI